MQALELLHQRASIPAKLLSEPAPNPQQLKQIIQAALTAPDHAGLHPWHFIVIEGDSRAKLGDVFARAARLREPSLPDDKIERQRQKPMRSPMIITVIANIAENHEKVPRIEQILSAGAAAQHILLAANSLGFGSIWLTGPNAFDPVVKEALGVEAKNEIIGFIYLGSSDITSPTMRRPETEAFVSHW